MARTVRARRRWWFLGGAGAVAAGLVGGLLALPGVVAHPAVQGWGRQVLGRQLGHEVAFSRLTLTYRPTPALHVRDLGLTAPGAPAPWFRAEEVVLRPAVPRPATGWRPVVLELRRLQVVLGGGPDAGLPAALRASRRPVLAGLLARVEATEGRVLVQGADGWSPAHFDLRLEAPSWSRPIRLTGRAWLPQIGLEVAVTGTVGPLAAAGGDPGALPVRLLVQVGGASGSAGPVEAAGTLRAQGRLGRLGGGGRLTFARLGVPAAAAGCPGRGAEGLVLEDVDLPLTLAGSTWSVRPFRFRLDGGTVRGHLELRWDGPSPELRLSSLVVEDLPLERVLAGYLCHPLSLGGRLRGRGEVTFAGGPETLLRSARGRWEAEVGPGRLVGPGALRLGRAVIRAILAPRPAPVVVPDPIEFDRLVAAGTVEAGTVVAREIRWTSPEAHATGQGSLGLLDARVDLRLAVRAGRRTVPLLVRGPADDPAGLRVERAEVGAGAPLLSTTVLGSTPR